MKSRIDFYTKVHKALRASLFELSQRAATTDYLDAAAAHAMRAATHALVARLSAHAGHEARFIHPLLADRTGESRFDGEHADLEVEQEALARLVTEACQAPVIEQRERGAAFYRALNRFIARYLEHLDAEERAMPLLWERCSDEELAEVMARFGASREIEETLADIGWMLPALSTPEQGELLNGAKAALMRR